VTQQIVTTLKNIAGYGLWFAVVGCILGSLVGALGGEIHEYMPGISIGNGPVLIMFTASIGLVCGILYGMWKEYF
jgi:hypothetical protein